MLTKPYTLQSGKVITLTMPDLYLLVATDVDIPNEALTDIMDLAVYGAMLSGTGDEKKRLEENKRFLRSQFELATLCISQPKLILRGDTVDGCLTPADLTPRDLNQIAAFFLKGGSQGAPAATSDGLEQGAQDDTASAAVGEDAIGNNPS